MVHQKERIGVTAKPGEPIARVLRMVPEDHEQKRKQADQHQQRRGGHAHERRRGQDADNIQYRRESADAAATQESLGRVCACVPRVGQEHAGDELGEPGERDAPTGPQIEPGLRGEQHHTPHDERQTDPHPDERSHAPRSQHPPQQGEQQVKLHRQPDVPPRGREIIQARRCDAQADDTRPALPGEEREPVARDQEEREERHVGEPVGRIQAQEACPQEHADGQSGRGVPLHETPGEAETAEQDEKGDALITGPAEPPEQVQRQVPEAVARERRDLRDALLQGRPVGLGVGQVRTAEGLLCGVVDENPEEAEAFDAVQPRNTRVHGSAGVPSTS